MGDLERFVPNVHFEKIPIKNLVSNQDYQRNLSQAHIEKTAENFDIFQINPVKVSRRDGINYVFNGQHTIEIVALASGSRETPVWCMIYDDLCYAHEADIFANQMKFVKSLLPYEIFMANIEAKNPDQLMIRDLVESYGMKISAKRAPGHICAVSTLEAIYKKYGYQVLNRVLRLIIATWEGDSNSFSANIMNAVAKLCVVYKNQLNDETFAEKVGAVSIKQLTRTARERRPGSMGYAEAMILEYNGKKKTSAGKLFMNKLYAKDVSLWIEPDEDDLSEEADEFESLILGQFGDDEDVDENNE